MNLPADDDGLRAWIADELLAIVAIPSYSGEEHALVEYLETRCRAWDLPVARRSVAGADLAGSQTVVFGPGSLRGAHQPGESVAVGEVLACARILARMSADLTAHGRT